MYIDESGTIGPKTKEPYFVIAAVIFDDEHALKRVKNIIRRAKKATGQLQELKATKLNTAQKQAIVFALAKHVDYKIAYIVVQKSKISQKLYEHKNVTYNFLFGILMKRILNTCGEDVRIVADNRTTKVTSADSLCDYIRAKAYGDWQFQHDITIEQAESHMHHGLQAADLVANTVFAKYNFDAQHLYNMHVKHYLVEEKFPYKDFGSMV